MNAPIVVKSLSFCFSIAEVKRVSKTLMKLEATLNKADIKVYGQRVTFKKQRARRDTVCICADLKAPIPALQSYIDNMTLYFTTVGIRIEEHINKNSDDIVGFDSVVFDRAEEVHVEYTPTDDSHFDESVMSVNKKAQPGDNRLNPNKKKHISSDYAYHRKWREKRKLQTMKK